MTSLRTIILSSILFLVCNLSIHCVNFCDVKSFDSVFNIGHLIYFVRCGEMWTFDPRLNGGEGDLIRDFSPLIAIKKWIKIDMKLQNGEWNRTKTNLTGFAIQELNCVHQEEDTRGKCKKSIDVWNHLTVLAYEKWMYIFDYDTEYLAKNQGFEPFLFERHAESTTFNAINKFWPKMMDIAPEFKFDEKKLVLRHFLFDPVRYYLYLAIKNEAYYCVTYLSMKDMLFDEKEWPNRQNPAQFRKKWVKANCFIGRMQGWFFLNNQAYIVGQVLVEDRVYDDQVYRMNINGGSMVEFQPINHQIDDENIEPETVRRFFGCYKPKQKQKWIRKKRSTQQTIKTKRQRITSLFKRVANNLLIQLMAFVLVCALIYRLVFFRMNRNKIHKIF